MKDANRCPETQSTLLLYLYGEAPDPKAFEAHLESCEECRRTLAEHSGVVKFYREHSSEAPGRIVIPERSSIWEKVLEALRAPATAPAFAVAVALLVAVAFVSIVRMEKPQPTASLDNVTLTFNGLESKLDELDTQVDALLTMNAESGFETTDEDSEKDYGNISDISDELDTIQEDMRTF